MDNDYTSLINTMVPSFEKFEGRSPWLYLDHLGHLTIGVGHLVHKKGTTLEDLKAGINQLFPYGVLQLRTNAEFARSYVSSCQAVRTGKKGSAATARRTTNAAMARLGVHDGYKTFFSSINPSSGLLSATTGDGATPGVWGYDMPSTDAAESNVSVMVDEAMQIEKLPVGWKMPIVYFRCFNSYQLTEAAIDKLLADDIATKIKEVKAEPVFKDFDTFPLPAQVAVIDLAFQYGATGLAHHTKFAAAVKRLDWSRAMTACPAGVAQAERTQFRKNKLKEAGAPNKPPVMNRPTQPIQLRLP